MVVKERYMADLLWMVGAGDACDMLCGLCMSSSVVMTSRF